MSVSIAMAIYNGERFLGEQLASLARQRLRPCELVVCDDGSEDRTLDVLERFAAVAPFPVRIRRNPRTLGYADNFLQAASLCRGDLVAFCDQDDVWLPNKLERCASVQAQSDAPMVLHTGQIVDAHLRPSGGYWPPIARTRVLPRGNCNPWLVPPGFAMMVSRRLLTEIPWGERPPHPTSPDRPMSHDLWAYFLASVLGDIVMLAEPLALYRQHDSNTCGAYTAGFGEQLRLSRIAGSETYRQRSELAGAYAAFLEGLAMKVAPPLRPHCQSGASFYHGISQHYRLRSALHQARTSPIERFRYFSQLLSSRSYRCRDQGGLGAPALIKDTLTVALGRVP